MQHDEVMQIAVQLAFEHGAIIEFNRKVNPHDWVEIQEPVFDFSIWNYRVKHNSPVKFMFSNHKTRVIGGGTIIDCLATSYTYHEDNITLASGWVLTGVICFIYIRDSGKLLDSFVCR